MFFFLRFSQKKSSSPRWYKELNWILLYRLTMYINYIFWWFKKKHSFSPRWYTELNCTVDKNLNGIRIGNGSTRKNWNWMENKKSNKNKKKTKQSTREWKRTFDAGLVAVEEPPAKQIAVEADERQVQVAEEFDVLDVDFQLLRRVPMDDLTTAESEMSPTLVMTWVWTLVAVSKKFKGIVS